MFTWNWTALLVRNFLPYYWFMGYDLPHRHCFGYVGEEAHCYSPERGVASTPHSIWSILQHLQPVFEFAGLFALDQVGLANMDPLHRLNGRATKICMI